MKNTTNKKPKTDWLGRPIYAHSKALSAKGPRPTTKRGGK